MHTTVTQSQSIQTDNVQGIQSINNVQGIQQI